MKKENIKRKEVNKMYYVYDYYEGRQLVGKFEDWIEMSNFLKEYRKDTDGECDLDVEYREIGGEF